MCQTAWLRHSDRYLEAGNNLEYVSSVSSNRSVLKILPILVAVATVVFVLINVSNEDTASVIIPGMSIGLSFGAGAFALLISKQHWKTKMFGRSYLLLGMGFMSYAVAEVAYYVLDYFGMDAYPSIADVFFFALYPFVFGYLFLNIRFFLKQKLTAIQKTYLPAIPVAFVTIYSVLSLTELEQPNFDFYLVSIFVIAASSVFSLSVLGVSIFKKSQIGMIWLFLSTAILLNAIGDLIYYNLEIFGAYDDTYPVTLMWHVSNMIIIYALYTHKRHF